MQPVGCQVELGGDELAVLLREQPHLFQHPGAIVTPRQNFEQRAEVGGTGADPLTHQADHRLGRDNHLLDPLGTVRCVRIRDQVSQLLAHRRDDLRAVGHVLRLVEVAVPHTAGQLTDDRVTDHGGRDNSLEHLGQRIVRGGLVGDLEPTLQERGNHRHLSLGALQREEHAIDRVLQPAAGLQIGDVVVRQRPQQPGPERLRQTFPLDVERVQVGVQVLARGVHVQVGTLLLLARGPVAGELADVGKGGQQREFGRDQVRIVGRQRTAQLRVLADQCPRLAGAHVVTGDQRAQRVEDRRRPPGGLDLGLAVAGEHHGRGVGDHGLLRLRVQPHQGGPGRDLRVDRGEDFADPTGDRGHNRGLHLHGLEHRDCRARLDDVAHLDRQGDDHGRRGRADDAALVASDAVADAVDLHEVVGRAGGEHDAVDPPVHRQPVGEPTLPLYRDLGLGAVGRDPVPRRGDLIDPQFVVLALVPDLDVAPDGVVGLRTTAAGRDQERLALGGLLPGVPVDGNGVERDVGVGGQGRLGVQPDPVQPCRVGRAGQDLLAVEQVEHERLVRGAALDDDGGVAQRAPQSGDRLSAVPPGRDDLGDHRVELRRDGVAGRDPGVDADARSLRELQELHLAGRGREAVVRVLRIEPDLDRVGDLGRALPRQRLAAGREDLQLDQVDAGRGLGDRVLDLQAGVDLEERKGLGGRVVEVLDRAGAVVAHLADQVHRDPTQFEGLLAGQDRRGRLLDDLLVATLDGAVAHTWRPDIAVLVGDDLHLDVPGAGDQRLQEHAVVAEVPGRIGASALVGSRQLAGLHDLSDAAATAAGLGLDDQRVPDALRVILGLRDTLHATGATPRRHGHANPLGHQLGLDLVAEQPHRLGLRADECDAEPVADFHEAGVLGDEPPAHPDSVGTALHQRALELGVVQIWDGRGGTGAQQDSFVGLTHEHGRAFALGVHGDGSNPESALLVELADCTDQADRRLTAVYNGNSSEH